MKKLFAAAAMMVFASVQAQAAWPEKDIRIVVPYAPGGSTDNTMRSIHPALEEILGRSITLENIGGGAGLIGTAKGLQAPADGYTFIMNPTATLANIYTREMPFDVNELQPVANTSSSWVAVAVRPGLPAKNVQELAAYGRENPLTFSSSGVGSITHIYAELFAASVGIEMTHVPYRGSSEALNALMGGHVDVQVDSNILPQFKTGSVTGIGYINDRRWPGFPELALLSEQGSDVPSLSWFGLTARKGIPQEAVDGMTAAVEKALERDEVKQRLLNLGLYPNYQDPEEFAAQIERSRQAFRTVLAKLGMVPAK